jgi:hypothetical protein
VISRPEAVNSLAMILECRHIPQPTRPNQNLLSESYEAHSRRGS